MFRHKIYLLAGLLDLLEHNIIAGRPLDGHLLLFETHFILDSCRQSSSSSLVVPWQNAKNREFTLNF